MRLRASPVSIPTSSAMGNCFTSQMIAYTSDGRVSATLSFPYPVADYDTDDFNSELKNKLTTGSKTRVFKITVHVHGRTSLMPLIKYILTDGSKWSGRVTELHIAVAYGRRVAPVVTDIKDVKAFLLSYRIRATGTGFVSSVDNRFA